LDSYKRIANQLDNEYDILSELETLYFL